MSSGLRIALLLSALALGLGGCGLKGALEPPPGAKVDAKAQADSGQGKKEGEAPKPHRDFILDGLIR